jgi:hypothetical protein
MNCIGLAQQKSSDSLGSESKSGALSNEHSNEPLGFIKARG